MKRSALQCVVGFVGATLIVVGVVWTCSQLSAPTQLNAAQGTPAQSTSNVNTKSALQRPTGSLTLSVTSQDSLNATSAPTILASEPTQSKASKIRPTSAGSLDLSVVDTEELPTSNDYPNLEQSTLDVFDPFDQNNGSTEIESPSLNSFPQGAVQTETSYAVETEDYSLTETSASNDKYVNEYQNASSFDVSATNETPQVVPQTSNNAVGIIPQPLGASIEDEDVVSTSAPYENDLDNTDVFPTQNAQLASDVDEQSSSIATPIPSINQIQPATSGDPVVAPSIPAARLSSDSPASFGNAKETGTLSNALLQFVTKDAASKATSDETLLGPQAAHIVISKSAPEEVQINKPTTVVVSVKNSGDKPVKNIVLRDSVPTGAKFESSSPEVRPNAQGELIWSAFDLQPGAEKEFEYTIIPLQEGNLGSVATVMLVAAASSQIRCSRPELKVEVSAPEEVEIGENVVFNIVVTNVGTGAANNVVLQENIPDGLHHPSGSVLTNSLGKLNPGESKKLPLKLQSVAPGVAVNTLSISADDCETKTAETNVNVIAPMLELAIAGPQNVYLEREATYKLTVKNAGDASAFDVKLIAQLPEGVEFVQTDNLGAYKEDEHSVYWDLAELPVNVNADINLTVKTIKASKTELVFGATGPNNLTAQTSQAISIDGIAALSFNVTASTDLVEVGKEFEYTIQIDNRGTKASNNVVLQVRTPDAITVLGTSGPTNAVNRRGVIVFEKLDVIEAKSRLSYKIKAKPNSSGDCRVGFQLSSDDLEPLVKEENTRVYE